MLQEDKLVSFELSHSGSWLHHELVDQSHTDNNAQCSCLTIIPGYNHINPSIPPQKSHVLWCLLDVHMYVHFQHSYVYVYNNIKYIEQNDFTPRFGAVM